MDLSINVFFFGCICPGLTNKDLFINLRFVSSDRQILEPPSWSYRFDSLRPLG